MKERKRKIITITVIGIMLILAITTFTYAIWSRTHIQTGVNKNTYACFDISYEETSGTGITMENGFPQKDEDGLKNDAYEVQIKNTCDTVSTYNVILNKEQGSDLDDSHLKVAVDNDYKLLSTATKTDLRQIDNFTNEASYIIGTGVIGPKQTKIVQIRSWMDKDTTETDGENKSFTFKITIEAVAGINKEMPLQAMILSNEIKSDSNLDFTKGFPNLSTPSQDIEAKSGLYKTEDDDGETYYFRGKVENNYVTLGTNKEDAYLYMVGQGQNIQMIQGTYEAAVNHCNNYYNDYYNYGTAEECIQAIQKEPMQIFGQPIMWRIVRINGDGTIRLVTDNSVGGSAFNTVTNGYQYVGYTYDNTTPCTKDKPCKSEYSGDSFTNSNGGTDSTIKTYLENWYKTTLNEFDTKIAYGTYCNDTSYGSGSESISISYDEDKRVVNYQPSLQCPDPTKQGGSEKILYGGVYKLKVGMLTADEVILAGLNSENNNPYATRENYLLSYLKNNSKYYWYMWTMSPSCSSSSNASGFYGYSNGNVNTADIDDDSLVTRPVINLNSDVTVTGTGTQDNPYVVQ